MQPPWGSWAGRYGLQDPASGQAVLLGQPARRLAGHDAPRQHPGPLGRAPAERLSRALGLVREGRVRTPTIRRRYSCARAGRSAAPTPAKTRLCCAAKWLRQAISAWMLLPRAIPTATSLPSNGSTIPSRAAGSARRSRSRMPAARKPASCCPESRTTLHVLLIVTDSGDSAADSLRENRARRALMSGPACGCSFSTAVHLSRQPAEGCL